MAEEEEEERIPRKTQRAERESVGERVKWKQRHTTGVVAHQHMQEYNPTQCWGSTAGRCTFGF